VVGYIDLSSVTLKKKIKLEKGKIKNSNGIVKLIPGFLFLSEMKPFDPNIIQ